MIIYICFLYTYNMISSFSYTTYSKVHNALLMQNMQRGVQPFLCFGCCERDQRG